MKVIHILEKEDIDYIIQEHYQQRGIDADIKCIKNEVQYEIVIENWDIEQFN